MSKHVPWLPKSTAHKKKASKLLAVMLIEFGRVLPCVCCALQRLPPVPWRCSGGQPALSPASLSRPAFTYLLRRMSSSRALLLTFRFSSSSERICP